MQRIDITPQTFKVGDFLGWQRDGSLVLSPRFQRRPVWRPGAKSYFIDTVARGLPVPAIMIRNLIDWRTQRTVREVIDGQQRLRTLFSYIDPSTLADYTPKRDEFAVKRSHNPDLAGKRFSELDRATIEHVLEYRFSTHVLPAATEDRDILQMFARINATGVRLNEQELRNAEFYGVFKTLMYQLALEQLERWREWGVFNDNEIARMDEVELASDLALTMIDGLSAKRQSALGALYRRFDDEFPGAEVFAARFRTIMDAIDELLGRRVRETVYRRAVHFFTLFVCLYDHLYGLGTPLDKRRQRSLPDGIVGKLVAASEDIAAGNVPPDVLDAVRRATADRGRRRTRLDYLAGRVAASGHA
ncbi:MAG: DUF262 domain-containing protein [Gemmatimonadaceae bacterium]